jgi:hypothetical protein
MANFGVVKKIRGEKALNSSEIIEAIKDSLGKNLTYDVLSETGNTLTVSGVEKGAPYKFEATFRVDVEDNKAKISVEGAQKITGLFTMLLCACVIFSWMFLPLIGLIIGIIRLNTNKNLYTRKMEEVLSSVDAQVSW